MEAISLVRFLLFVQLLLTPSFLYPQGNQANNWYFGNYAGIRFQSDQPTAVTDGALSTIEGCAAISTPEGELQFYTDGSFVYDRTHNQMPNGSGLFGHGSSTQSAIIVPRPGSTREYYIFTVDAHENSLQHGLCYSKVDMQLNGGLGDVVTSEKNIELVPFTCEKVTAVAHSDGESYWVITKLFGNADFHAYRVTIDGVNTEPVISTAGIPVYAFNFFNSVGYMKASPDGRFLSTVSYYQQFIGIFRFDNSTGVVTHLTTDLDFPVQPYGVEFSPNNKLLYVSARTYPLIFQYDLSSEDTTTILNSRLQLTLHNTADASTNALQLGPDNRIYISRFAYGYLSRINLPNNLGNSCDFEENAVFLEGKTCRSGLPPFIQSFFFPLEFTFNQNCSGQPTQFQIIDPAGIDSVLWQFNDDGNYPYDTSTLFNPSYQFSHGDTFYVKLTAWSEIGPRTRIDTVIINQSPNPDFGNDTLFCADITISLQLNAGSGDLYNWNGSFSPGDSTYMVNDTGTYWVRVRNQGCTAYDTIHVGLHPDVYFDISEVQISPTTCGNSTGAIRGIKVNPGAQVEWRDGNQNLLGTNTDISLLGVGNYVITIFDTTGCIKELPPFTINNINSDLIILSADASNAFCTQPNGRIIINTSVFSDLLVFSIDNGNTWHSNSGIFGNVLPGSYFVWAKDSEGCEAVFTGNPVHVPDVGGPDITFSGSTPTSGTNNDGTITVTATGDSLFFQLNGGPTQDTGYFTGLEPDVYQITVTDKYGCDTTVTVVVVSETGYQLSALAGDDRKCLHRIASSVLKVSNLNGVKDFKTTVTFNSLLMNCIGYQEKFDPTLSVTLFTNRIELEWHGNSPLSITDTVKLVDLVFESTQTGQADINWDLLGSSYFRDENGNDIPCIPFNGEIIISDPPVISIMGDANICEGTHSTHLTAEASLGMPPYTLQWRKPDGTSQDGSIIELHNINQHHSGNYILRLTDQYNCLVEDTLNLRVIPLPTIGFSSDTIAFEQSYLLQATPGYESYLWNTGATTYSITVSEEGQYSVIVNTEEGCESSDTVMMVSVQIPIQLPNAFTPNSDGLNDVFRPVTVIELMQRFHLAIYNKWGQQVFETSNPTEGWDGGASLPGIYIWTITYENKIGTIYNIRGIVSLIR